ncbi:NAD(P)-dependent oxidoreductase, partial [Candidatus Giovannonibacteria bacterium RIFCSPHIGHO2_12_FULL_43_15]
VANAKALAQAIKNKKSAITSNYDLLCASPDIDVIVEASGEVEFGARVVTSAIKNKKHVVLINAELDSTLGPILKRRADEAGVIYTQTDGDQPGVLMNLYRFVKSIGFKPVMAGNIKSLIDARRTPETQKAFAEAHFQRPKMITSFADGTKISMEMATVANATGFKIIKRGMAGPRCARVEEAVKLFPMDELMDGGIVDYILGAEPSFGVFILGYNNHPLTRQYMNMYKMGDGPLYTFYVPYHLSPIETSASVGQAFIFKDATIAPLGGLVAEVVTLAKRDLKAGEVLDGIGGFTVYGAIDNYKTAKKENLLPMGLSDGCKLKRDIKMDEAIAYSDVDLPADRLSLELRKEQDKIFG